MSRAVPPARLRRRPVRSRSARPPQSGIILDTKLALPLVPAAFVQRPQLQHRWTPDDEGADPRERRPRVGEALATPAWAGSRHDGAIAWVSLSERQHTATVLVVLGEALLRVGDIGSHSD